MMQRLQNRQAGILAWRSCLCFGHGTVTGPAGDIGLRAPHASQRHTPLPSAERLDVVSGSGYLFW